MLRLHNLEDGDIKIMNLDAKLSLQRNERGGLDLLIHPVYREMMTPAYVTDEEAEKLSTGELSALDKVVEVNGIKKEVVIEFDQDTQEFVITDTERILAPDLVNNEKLTPEQKQRFKKGKEVELQDGTKFRFSATASEGMRSNRLHLIASLIVDGGLSYVLYKGLKAMSKKEPKVSEDYSRGYYHALEDMKVRQVKDRMKGQNVNSR
ncbi:MAG TPA: DUF3945 domain-containing protein [Mucilaginibacter sp.]|nr:DUF3945 domain-containing protein [Mucilaginibacter sp.]